MDHKTCTKCKEEKVTTEFSFLKAKQVYHSWCKRCSSSARLKAYHEDPKKHRDYDKVRRSEIREFVKSQKFPCIVCEESDPVVIDFHHREPGGKDFNVANGFRYSLERVKAEIEKCVTLCANCHRKVHAGSISL